MSKKSELTPSEKLGLTCVGYIIGVFLGGWIALGLWHLVVLTFPHVYKINYWQATVANLILWAIGSYFKGSKPE
jgi:hypothetical protein